MSTRENIRLIARSPYSLTVKKVEKKSDYSICINFFFNSLKKKWIIHFFRPSIFTIHDLFCLLFTIHYKKGPLFTNHYTPSKPSYILPCLNCVQACNEK